VKNKFKILFIFLFISLISFLIQAQTTNSSTNVVTLNGYTITTIVAITSNETNVSNLNSTNNSAIINGTTNNATTTVATNLLQVLGASSNTQKITSSFLNNFIDTIPYIKNDIVNIDYSELYNFSQKKFGDFFGFDIPVGSQSDLGAGALQFNKTWGLVPLDVKLGVTVNYPFIGNIYNFVSLGPILEIPNGQLGTYDFLGGVKTWDISSRFKLSLGGNVGDISYTKGLDLGVVSRLDYHF
jgi:hypothetical protein